MGSDDAGMLFHRPVNHEPSRAHSSGLSAAWIRLNWLPGVIPRPSVVNGQLPVMTRVSDPAALPAISVDCGMAPGALQS